MSIIGACIIPHLPLLVPTIGKEQIVPLQPLVKAIKKIVSKYTTQGIDTIVIISDHNGELKENFIIKLCPNFKLRFDKFGDLATELNFTGDMGLAYKLKESVETKVDLSLSCDINLEYGFAIPLFFWQSIMPLPTIIPILTAPNKNLESHFDFGKQLQTVVHNTSKRVLIITTGDLADQTSLTNEKPNKDFDNYYLKTLRSSDLKSFLQQPGTSLSQANQCILNPSLVLAGLLDNMKYTAEILAYDANFQTGLTVVDIKL